MPEIMNIFEIEEKLNDGVTLTIPSRWAQVVIDQADRHLGEVEWNFKMNDLTCEISNPNAIEEVLKAATIGAEEVYLKR